MTAMWVSMSFFLPGIKPLSLFRMARMYLSVESRPFIRKSPLPSLMSFTAKAPALLSLASWTISNLLGSMPSSAQTFFMVSMSPTRVASTMPRSMAALTAAMVWLSLA